MPVYWKNFVREALIPWRSEEDLEVLLPEKVVVHKQSGEYVGLSSVHDYMYRPKIHEDKTLYEWIQMASRVKVSKIQKHDTDIDDDELDLIEETVSASPQKTVHAQNEESDAESDELNIKDHDFIVDDIESDTSSTEDDITDDKLQPFLKGHPLYKTHKAKFDMTKNENVPNFIGGSLPRYDRCDREYYCATTLTLFKPWRSGEDLKTQEYSWDETFNDHKFTSRQSEIMQYFNIRYECNDARDDYSTQQRKGDVVDGAFP